MNPSITKGTNAVAALLTITLVIALFFAAPIVFPASATLAVLLWTLGGMYSFVALVLITQVVKQTS